MYMYINVFIVYTTHYMMSKKNETINNVFFHSSHTVTMTFPYRKQKHLPSSSL